jgi:hypothetical protein
VEDAKISNRVQSHDANLNRDGAFVESCRSEALYPMFSRVGLLSSPYHIRPFASHQPILNRGASWAVSSQSHSFVSYCGKHRLHDKDLQLESLFAESSASPGLITHGNNRHLDYFGTSSRQSKRVSETLDNYCYWWLFCWA